MGDLGTTALLYASRPSLALDGEERTDLAEALLSLVVRESAEGLYRCECIVGNWGPIDGGLGFLHFDRSALDFGKPLAVTLGDGEARRQVFAGRISALEGRFPADRSPELCVLAEDRLQDLRMTRRTRTFEDASDEDVIRQVAGDHGLTPETDLDGPTHRVLAQLNQSDLAFLRERARAVGAELWVEGDTLHAVARARRSEGAVTLTYGQGLLELSIGADLALQRTSWTVGGWDVSAKEAIEEEATASAIQSELNGGRSGAELLEQAFGSRSERQVHGAPATSAEALAAAQAAFRGMARGFVRGCGLAEGDARLRVGSKVDLKQIGELFGGSYDVVAVEHLFDLRQGYRTRFEIERPGLGGAA